MNKTDLISKLRERNNDIETNAAAARIVDDVFAVITEGVVEDGRVAIVGFGSFELTKRAARKCINPITKEPMKTKATKVVKFRPGASFKDAAAKSRYKLAK